MKTEPKALTREDRAESGRLLAAALREETGKLWEVTAERGAAVVRRMP
jgi:hypothetical protein